jgi:hypothetical protein
VRIFLTTFPTHIVAYLSSINRDGRSLGEFYVDKFDLMGFSWFMNIFGVFVYGNTIEMAI